MSKPPVKGLCPVCRTELMMTDRQGVEIDYCPLCRGVWLDRGELDKIIERSATGALSTMRPSPAGNEREYERRPYRNDGDDTRRGTGVSWLGDLFDVH